MDMQEQAGQFKPWQGYLILGVLFIAIVLGVVQFATRGSDEVPVDNGPVLLLIEASCKASGGAWNACGSACRGQENEDACISVCVEYCECNLDLQCPFGFECTDHIDQIGICTNTSSQ